MAVASQSQAIQQLLQAEKQATKKVSWAHRQKNQRLKQPKEAAQAEIEQHCLQKEKQFKAKEAAALGSHRPRMTILQTYFQQSREEVLDQLLAFVCGILPEIPENYHING
nr:V-type proton ATPase subunit G 1-like [Chlorocebus sabaeus]